MGPLLRLLSSSLVMAGAEVPIHEAAPQRRRVDIPVHSSPGIGDVPAMISFRLLPRGYCPFAYASSSDLCSFSGHREAVIGPGVRRRFAGARRLGSKRGGQNQGKKEKRRR
jgi:hypothetical protein